MSRSPESVGTNNSVRVKSLLLPVATANLPSPWLPVALVVFRAVFVLPKPGGLSKSHLPGELLKLGLDTSGRTVSRYWVGGTIFFSGCGIRGFASRTSQVVMASRACLCRLGFGDFAAMRFGRPRGRSGGARSDEKTHYHFSSARYCSR